jgi:hypothetical protein
MWPDDADLDMDALPSIEALTIEPEHTPADVRDEMNRLLGVGVPRRRYQPDGPDVEHIRKAMGI